MKKTGINLGKNTDNFVGAKGLLDRMDDTLQTFMKKSILNPK